MHAILRRSTITAAFAASVLIAACSGENPASITEAPSAPRFDGGVGLGSGSRDGGVTFGSGSRTTSGSENTTTAADSGSTAGRGGLGFGSGS
jgi:hypothetical protein